MISTKNIIGTLFVSLLSVSTFANEPDKDCVDWFKRAKITIGSKDCELKCATLTWALLCVPTNAIDYVS